MNRSCVYIYIYIYVCIYVYMYVDIYICINIFCCANSNTTQLLISRGSRPGREDRHRPVENWKQLGAYFSCSANTISNQKCLSSYRDQVKESGDTLSEIRGLIALTNEEAKFWMNLESLTIPSESKHSVLLRIWWYKEWQYPKSLTLLMLTSERHSLCPISKLVSIRFKASLASCQRIRQVR